MQNTNDAGATGEAKGQTNGQGAPQAPEDAPQETATAGSAPQNEQATNAAAPGSAAIPANRSSSRRMFQFTLNVPFPTHVEAEIAREYLFLYIHRQGPVHLEQMVNNTVLTVQLTAEDPERLRLAIISCLDQLARAVRTMQCLVSRFSTKSRLEREG